MASIYVTYGMCKTYILHLFSNENVKNARLYDQIYNTDLAGAHFALDNVIINCNVANWIQGFCLSFFKIVNAKLKVNYALFFLYT